MLFRWSDVYISTIYKSGYINTLSVTLNGLYNNGYLVLVSTGIGASGYPDSRIANFATTVAKDTSANTTTLSIESWDSPGFANSTWRIIAWN